MRTQTRGRSFEDGKQAVDKKTTGNPPNKAPTRKEEIQAEGERVVVGVVDGEKRNRRESEVKPETVIPNSGIPLISAKPLVPERLAHSLPINALRRESRVSRSLSTDTPDSHAPSLCLTLAHS